jgi:hypothetical protein
MIVFSMLTDKLKKIKLLELLSHIYLHVMFYAFS